MDIFSIAKKKDEERKTSFTCKSKCYIKWYILFKAFQRHTVKYTIFRKHQNKQYKMNFFRIYISSAGFELQSSVMCYLLCENFKCFCFTDIKMTDSGEFVISR